jgi:hypothetical protein
MPGDRDPRPHCKLPDGVTPPPSMAPASLERHSGCGSCPEIVCVELDEFETKEIEQTETLEETTATNGSASLDSGGTDSNDSEQAESEVESHHLSESSGTTKEFPPNKMIEMLFCTCEN